MSVGGLLVIAGFIVWMTSRGDTVVSSQPTVTVMTPATATAVAAASTTSSFPLPSTTTSTQATSTTLDSTTKIEAFVIEFAEAIDLGDSNFLISTLHPAVLAVHGETSCSAFIDAEILLLMGYQLTGPLGGPSTQTVADFSIEVFSGPVAFTFQGQSFEATASFAVDDGQVRWFAECRLD